MKKEELDQVINDLKQVINTKDDFELSLQNVKDAIYTATLETNKIALSVLIMVGLDKHLITSEESTEISEEIAKLRALNDIRMNDISNN